MPTNKKEWQEEARTLISKVCCDGQYVNEAISFIENLLTEQDKVWREKIEKQRCPDCKDCDWNKDIDTLLKDSPQL